MLIDIDQLAPEERDLISQFGKISRPFWHDPSKLRTISYIANALNVLTLADQTWEVVGVDVSAWQGDIDMSILATKVSFVIIRYLYGNSYYDPRALEYVQGAVDNKLPYGGYVYMKPGKSFSQQPINFKAKCDEYSSDYQVIYPMVDFEENGGLNKNDLNNWTTKFYMNLCGAWGYPFDNTGLKHFMTYTSPGFLDTNMPLTNYMKWTHLDDAHWTSAPQPIRPQEWAKPDFPWKFWQHAVVDATTPIDYGVQSSKIDLQRYNGTKQDFEHEFNVTITPPPPPAPEYLMVNTQTLNLRSVPTTSGNAPIGETWYGRVWKTTGKTSPDVAGRGLWYEVADEHGQTLWLAGWLCKLL